MWTWGIFPDPSEFLGVLIDIHRETIYGAKRQDFFFDFTNVLSFLQNDPNTLQGDMTILEGDINILQG